MVVFTLRILDIFMSRRVVITGMGIWSCLGTTLEEVKNSLYSGKSGIGLEPERLAYGYRSGLTGIVAKPKLKGVLDRRMRVGLPEEGEYAFMATKEAFEMAGIDADYADRQEIGVIYGNDSTAKPVIEASKIMEEKHDSALLGSGYIFQSMNSTVTMNLSTIFRLRGVNFTVSAACASGSHAVGLGYMLIKQGLQEMVVCGGAQETNFYSMATFDALSAFSVRMDDPTKASRPFDRDRDGLIPSGGAATLILEDYDHAIARGATILGEVCGYGFSSNGGGISQPSDVGSEIAMLRAMKDAGVAACDIDYVNAHATSTLQGDMFEAIALDRIFHSQRALISSTKSMTGHMLGAAGGLELVLTAMAVEKGIVPPTIGLTEPDPACDLYYTPLHAEEHPIDIAISNSLGFGGHNATVAIRPIR